MGDVLHILVVDDDWPMAKSLVDILRVKGYAAEAAYSGSEALERMEDDQFDCVLTDIKMPEVNGVELLRAIHAIRPGLPVVLMTAYATGDLVRQGLAEGAVASLVKPLDIDIVLSFLSRLGEGWSVVIVNDDPEFGRTWAERLRERGFPIIETIGTGDLEMALRPDDQVILLHLEGDSVTPMEPLTEIRRRSAHIPVVVVTDQREASPLVEDAAKLSVDAWLCEPLRTEELIGALKDARRRELGRLLAKGSATMVI